MPLSHRSRTHGFIRKEGGKVFSWGATSGGRLGHQDQKYVPCRKLRAGVAYVASGAHVTRRAVVNGGGRGQTTTLIASINYVQTTGAG